MKKILITIPLILGLMGCEDEITTYKTPGMREYTIVNIDGCEYIYIAVGYHGGISHKGDCMNPIHKMKIKGMEKPKELLSKEEYIKAFDWCGEHLMHVDRLISDLDGGYPPSEEDMGQPMLWKPENWFWFLKNL